MRTFCLVTLYAVCGCGDNNTIATISNDVANDAAVTVPSDAPIASVDAAPDAAFTYQCDYIEQQDATNDYEQTPGAEEDTPWGIGCYPGPCGLVLCGNINAGHYNAAFNSIDIDRFTFDVSMKSTVTINFSGEADYISSQILGTGNGKVGVFIVDHDTGSTVMGSFFQGSSATFTGILPSTSYESKLYDLDVEAYDTEEDIQIAIPYAIEIIAYGIPGH
jgi:hypothetical protein